MNQQLKKIDGEVVNVNYNELELKSFNELPNEFLENRDYILLSNEKSSPIIGRIKKVRFENNRLYILDPIQNSILIYDINGQYINKISKVGRANNEYLTITDFDISGNQLCILDGSSDKVVLCKDNGDFIKSKKLGFEADIVSFFKDGFLFGLSQWNSGESKGAKIAYADDDFNVKQNYLQYDEFIDPSYEISSYEILESNGKSTYNRNIDNNIYLFDDEFKLDKTINLDFGKNNVPDEHKKHIEQNIDKFNSTYYLIKDFALIRDHYIIGKLRAKGKSVAFIVDMKNGVRYEAAPAALYENTTFTSYDDNILFSYFTNGYSISSDEVLPDSVKNHIINDGCVVELEKLR